MIAIKDYPDLLFPYAYNVLGSVDDAKDVVQEVMGNFFTSNYDSVKNDRAYLIRSVINKAINIKKKQKKVISERVELPEPIATEKTDLSLHLKDIVSYSLLILLEKLNVKERAVFILKEAFSYSHQEIAGVISSTPENSRKLLSRAKAKIKENNQPDKYLKRSETEEYLGKYIQAIRNRDVKQLESLLTNDITIVADGGDEISVLKNFTTGRNESIDLLIEVYNKFQTQQALKIASINHQPAIIYFHKDQLTSCQIFSINKNQRIYKISSVVDPSKLKNLKVFLK